MSESEIKKEVRLALGAHPSRVVLWNNPVGRAAPVVCCPKCRNVFKSVPNTAGTVIPYGLRPGAADLMGVRAGGQTFCIETKNEEGGEHEAAQKLFGALIVRLGGFYAVVRSGQEALDALSRAERGGRE